MDHSTTVGEVYRFIDSIAPFDTQESWDNSGLLVGSAEEPVCGIGTALEITAQVLEQAHRLGVNLIVTHHPVIFHPAKAVLRGTVLWEAVCLGMNIICCHTPLDKADGGVNDTLAQRIGLRQPEKDDSGFLRIGTVGGITAGELAAQVRQELDAAALRCCGQDRRVYKAAVCSGAGADLMADAKALGCDALITGDAGHHDFLNAGEMGISLIAAGHYETERIIAPVLRERLLGAFPNVNVTLLEEHNPISVVE